MSVEEIRKMYPEGTQIELEEMHGEPQMDYGLKGIVRYVDDAGQIHVSWENGSSLALNVNEDQFSIIEPPQKISVLLVEPGKYPKTIEIEDTLEAMQEVVGGDIEEYMPFDDEVAIICNEDGKMNGSELNRAVYSKDKQILDVIAGKFFVAYAPFESESFLSMPKDLTKKYEDKFRYPERFYKTPEGIEAKAYKPVSKDMER